MQKPWISSSNSAQEIKPETYTKNFQEFFIFVEQIHLLQIQNLDKKVIFFLHKLDKIAKYAQQILHQEKLISSQAPHLFSEIVFLLNYVIENEKDSPDNRELVDFLLRYKAGLSTSLLFSNKFDTQIDLKDPLHPIAIRESGKQTYSFQYQLIEKPNQQQQQQQQQSIKIQHQRVFICPTLLNKEEIPLSQLIEDQFDFEIKRNLQMKVSLQRDVCEILEAFEQVDKDQVKVMLYLLYCDKDKKELINDIAPYFYHLRAQISGVSVPEIRKQFYLTQSDSLVLIAELEHCTLQEMIQERTKEGQPTRHWPIEQLNQLFQSLLIELQKLHKQAQIIHRDIRPQSIVYLRKSHKIGFKDFSKAYFQDSQSSQQQRKRIYGTLNYLSPQLEKLIKDKKDSDNIDLEKQDLYALGLTFYQMMNLRVQIDKQEVQKWLEQQKQKVDNISKTELLIINLLEDDESKRGSYIDQFISTIEKGQVEKEESKQNQDCIDDKELFKTILDKQKKKKKKQSEEDQLELSKLLAEIGLNKRREDILQQMLANLDKDDNVEQNITQQQKLQENQDQQKEQSKTEDFSNEKQQDNEQQKSKKNKKNKKSASDQPESLKDDKQQQNQNKQQMAEDPTRKRNELKSIILLELAKAVTNDHQKIYQYYKQALDLKINQQYIVNYVKMEGDFLFQEGNFEEAQSYYNLCFDNLDQNDPNYLIKKQQLLSCLGSNCLGLEKADFAIKYFQDSLLILEKKYGKNHLDYATVLQNIGECHYKLNHLDQALELYKQALQILQNDNKVDPEKIARALSNIGEVYRSKNELNVAIQNFENSLKIMETKFGKNSHYICPILNNIGLVYQQQKEHTKGLELLQRVIQIEEKAGLQESYEHSQTLINICIIYKDLKKKEEAKAVGLKAYKILLQLLAPDHPLVQKCTDILNMVEEL